MKNKISISQMDIGDTRWCLIVTIDLKLSHEFKAWLKDNCPDCYCKVKPQDNTAYGAYLSSYKAAYKKGIIVYEVRGGNPTDAFLIKLCWA
jgi:hypothetical protein